MRNSQKRGPHGISETGEPEATASANIHPWIYVWIFFCPRSHYIATVNLS